ncbi:MAG TPA: CHRD domain-containing protein, partial [Candidatus Methylomirabilis sp.]
MTRFMMLLVFLGFTGLVVSCGQDAPSSSSAVAGTPLAARKPDVALLPGGEPATPPTGNFVAHCTGGQEVPPVVTPGQGQAKFQFSADGSELSYRLLVTNLEDIVAAHIHIAPAGENGPVVAFLYG